MNADHPYAVGILEYRDTCDQRWTYAAYALVQLAEKLEETRMELAKCKRRITLLEKKGRQG